MNWIAYGAAQQAGRLMICLLIVGAAIGVALGVGVPWLIEHIGVVIR